MKPLLLFISLLLYILLPAQHILFQDYFPLLNGKVQVYTVSHPDNYSNPYDYDPERKICREATVKGIKVFYMTDAQKKGDTAIIGSEAFYNGAFYFKEGNFMVSPVFWKYELRRSKPEKYELLFPKQILFDTVYISRAEEETRKYKFAGFETVYIDGEKLDSCLKLEMEQQWPSETYRDKVWFKKNVGVVKWLRSTGRLEELQLPKRKK